jgi:N-acetylglucosaminyldiphosphoundecaprenol N-acetyl-beta-D-mannosaminyltransferase
MTQPPGLRLIRIGDITVHDILASETDEVVRDWLERPVDRARYLCTPNVDYVVRSRSNLAFRSAVEDADLRVPDGMWIVYASRIAGRPIRETVTGRLLLPRLAGHCRDTGRAISLFGAGPGVAKRAGEELKSRFPGLQVRHAISPPMDFEVGGAEDTAFVAELVSSPPSIVFVALGAPKQEIWMQQHATELPGTVLIGIGAGLDVVARRVREAPSWMTRTGLEWLFRLAQEPRRLARRYLVDDPWILRWAIAVRLGLAR